MKGYAILVPTRKTILLENDTVPTAHHELYLSTMRCTAVRELNIKNLDSDTCADQADAHLSKSKLIQQSSSSSKIVTAKNVCCNYFTDLSIATEKFPANSV